MLWIVDELPGYELVSDAKKIHLIDRIFQSIRNIYGEDCFVCMLLRRWNVSVCVRREAPIGRTTDFVETILRERERERKNN